MPELDGFSVIEQVRAKTPEVKIIVVSGASQQTERKAIEMGALCTMGTRPKATAEERAELERYADRVSALLEKIIV